MNTFLLCGQTDAGKSTIAGHILYNSGYFSDPDCPYTTHIPKDFEDSRRKSKYSELLDIVNGDIEDNKSKTVYYTELEFSYNGKRYTMIDTPGHQIYIRQLIEGLFSRPLDAICLVVSSIEKEFYESFERGTVKEDLLLARSTGCSTLFILFNKIDVNVPTNEMIEIITDYSKTLRYKNIKVLNISGYNGDNLMTFLDRIPNSVQRVKNDTVHTSFTITTTVSMHTKDLCTAGYVCILHHSSGEYSVEIEQIKLKGKVVPWIKTTDPHEVKFTLKKSITYSPQDRIVLRNSTDTIGFGVIG